MADKKKKHVTKKTDRKSSETELAAPEMRAQSEPDFRLLLREAAWSRMFGKTGTAKNPFSR